MVEYVVNKNVPDSTKQMKNLIEKLGQVLRLMA